MKYFTFWTISKKIFQNIVEVTRNHEFKVLNFRPFKNYLIDALATIQSFEEFPEVLKT